VAPCRRTVFDDDPLADVAVLDPGVRDQPAVVRAGQRVKTPSSLPGSSI
jgi:hypothetical protein